MLDDEAQEDLRANKNLSVYKGALYESIVGEALVKSGYGLYYYKKDNGTLEQDFFVRTSNSLIPLEVKSTNNKSRSLSTLVSNEKYSDIELENGITIKDFVNDAGFDSGSLYQYRDLTPTNRAYTEIFESVIKEYDEIASELNLVSYPHVSVGWDSNPRYNIFRDDVCYDNTPENVKKAFEYAKKYINTTNIKNPTGVVLTKYFSEKARVFLF